MKKTLYILLASIGVLSACSDDSILESSLTPEQQALIGTAIQFEPYAAEFDGTRVVKPNNHEGGFNYNDMMYIYRQYYEGGQWVYKTPPGTIYKYKEITYGDTELFEKNSWRVYEGNTFRFYDPSYTNNDQTLLDPNLSSADQPHSYYKTLTEADSITWESGTTVRFRAWVLSRMGNSLDDETPGVPSSINYPDYMVCDWVTVSGPTEKIPMAMRHLGGRLGFAPIANNEFVKIEIATDPADYMREDNADTNEHDEEDKHPEHSDPEHPEILTAAQCAANVKDVYDRMLWPAGVDMENLSLLACKNTDETQTYKKGDLSAEQIKEQGADGKYTIKHAQFLSSSDSRYYLVAIPYDMNTYEPLIFPPYTRFKVWLRDVNKGDAGTTEQQGSSENRYHIFRLSDVKLRNGSNKGQQAFPNGLTMMPGHSTVFYVGYEYETLQVYAEDSFSWEEQDLAAVDSKIEWEQAPVAVNYAWWSDAIDKACESVSKGGRYKPEFKITNAQEWQEFINLVNGKFTRDPIYKRVTIKYDGKTELPEREVKWYTGIGTNGDGTPDTLWIDREDLIAQGYVLYKNYTPSDAYRKASFEDEWLQAPFSFFDDQLKGRWTVKLAPTQGNIDMKDWKLDAVGTAATPFCGYFDGGGNLLKNVYVDGGQLFGYAQGGTIANLRLESSHPLSITGTCEDERVLGCSVIAPSQTAALAAHTKGFCYFVGCFHQGETTKPLVDDSQGLGFKMYGCMQAASGIASGTAALGNAPSADVQFVLGYKETMSLDSVAWTNVACNYYDTELSPGAMAFDTKLGMMPQNAYRLGTAGDTLWLSFHRLQYLRGVPTHIMCAKNDNLVDKKTEWNKLSVNQKRELYGAAPWRAMNYGIYMYNLMDVARDEEYNLCNMHYENTNTTGYSHRYPQLVSRVPTEEQYLEVLEQFN